MPEAPIDGVVLANELLDNLPFRLAVHDGAWREAFVATAPDGSFAEVLSAPFDPVPDVLPSAPTHGARAPLQDAAADVGARGALARAAWRGAGDRLRPTDTATIAALPWRSWLRTYRDHERGSHPLADPGAQDITVDVALDQLPEPDAVRTQAEFLRLHGIDELVDEGRAAWSAAAAAPDVRSARRCAAAPSRRTPCSTRPGLGGFSVLEWVS